MSISLLVGARHDRACALDRARAPDQVRRHVWLKILKEHHGTRKAEVEPSDAFRAVEEEGQLVSTLSRQSVLGRQGLARHPWARQQSRFLDLLLRALGP